MYFFWTSNPPTTHRPTSMLVPFRYGRDLIIGSSTALPLILFRFSSFCAIRYGNCMYYSSWVSLLLELVFVVALAIHTAALLLSFRIGVAMFVYVIIVEKSATEDRKNANACKAANIIGARSVKRTLRWFDRKKWKDWRIWERDFRQDSCRRFCWFKLIRLRQSYFIFKYDFFC